MIDGWERLFEIHVWPATKRTRRWPSLYGDLRSLMIAAGALAIGVVAVRATVRFVTFLWWLSAHWKDLPQ